MNGELDLSSRFADPDAAFRMLVEAHRGLSEGESARLNARLVLILANQLGSPDALSAAIKLAKDAGPLRSGIPERG